MFEFLPIELSPKYLGRLWRWEWFVGVYWIRAKTINIFYKKPTFSDFCKIIFCSNQREPQLSYTIRCRISRATKCHTKHWQIISLKIWNIDVRSSARSQMISHFSWSFRSEIISNEYSWRDILLVQISDRLVTPNLICGPNKGYIWPSGKLTKVPSNTCYPARVRYNIKIHQGLQNKSRSKA